MRQREKHTLCAHGRIHGRIVIEAGFGLEQQIILEQSWQEEKDLTGATQTQFAVDPNSFHFSTKDGSGGHEVTAQGGRSQRKEVQRELSCPLV